jgi:uncharacterized membrane protein
MKQFFDTHALKYLLGFVLVFAFRLMPFRVPNIEPVMAVMMPFAKHTGALGGFLFSSVSVALYDSVTSGWGVWTLVTALAYGLLGISAHIFLKNKENAPMHYLIFAILGTIVYDAVTGLTVGPLVWHQPFMVALVGQIPFTLLHIAGNTTFAALLSPLVYRYIVANPHLGRTRVAQELVM